jgi:hypothetical protein
MNDTKQRAQIKLLKSEIKSLAAQALFLRKEEQYSHDTGNEITREATHNYRTNDVRYFSRAAQLAYAMLRNKPFSHVEKHSFEKGIIPSLKTILAAEWMVSRFGDGKNISVREWIGDLAKKEEAVV